MKISKAAAAALALPLTLTVVGCSASNGPTAARSSWSGAPSQGLGASGTTDAPSTPSEAASAPESSGNDRSAADRRLLKALHKSDPSLSHADDDTLLKFFDGICDAVGDGSKGKDAVKSGVQSMDPDVAAMIDEMDQTTFMEGVMTACPAAFTKFAMNNPDLGSESASGPESSTSGDASDSAPGTASFGDSAPVGDGHLTVTLGKPQVGSGPGYAMDGVQPGQKPYTIKVTLTLDDSAPKPVDPAMMVMGMNVNGQQATEWYPGEGALGAAKMRPGGTFTYELGVYAKPGASITIDVSLLTSSLDGQTATWTGTVGG